MRMAGAGKFCTGRSAEPAQANTAQNAGYGMQAARLRSPAQHVCCAGHAGGGPTPAALRPVDVGIHLASRQAGAARRVLQFDQLQMTGGGRFGVGVVHGRPRGSSQGMASLVHCLVLPLAGMLPCNTTTQTHKRNTQPTPTCMNRYASASEKSVSISAKSGSSKTSRLSEGIGKAERTTKPFVESAALLLLLPVLPVLLPMLLLMLLLLLLICC